MKKNLIKANIIETKWRNRSIYGNPSYWVTFRDVESDNEFDGYTAPDAACAYGIRDFGKNETVWIEWHLTRSDKVVIDYIYKIKEYDKLKQARKADFIAQTKSISRNAKRNTLLNSICNAIFAQNEDYGGYSGLIQELKRYRHEFHRQLDYNYAQYANLLVGHAEIRDIYKQCGYSASSIDKLTDDQVWREYLVAVGEVIRFILEHENDIA